MYLRCTKRRSPEERGFESSGNASTKVWWDLNCPEESGYLWGSRRRRVELHISFLLEELKMYHLRFLQKEYSYQQFGKIAVVSIFFDESRELNLVCYLSQVYKLYLPLVFYQCCFWIKYILCIVSRNSIKLVN